MATRKLFSLFTSEPNVESNKKIKKISVIGTLRKQVIKYRVLVKHLHRSKCMELSERKP